MNCKDTEWNYNSELGKQIFYLSLVSSKGSIGTVGSFRVRSLAILDSNVNSNEGSNNKLESIANSKVIETSPPNALVPPKLETVKTRNPKKSTIEV